MIKIVNGVPTLQSDGGGGETVIGSQITFNRVFRDIYRRTYKQSITVSSSEEQFVVVNGVPSFQL